MSAKPDEPGSGTRDAVTSHHETCLDNPAIAEHLEGIRARCREYGVSRLEVFGSVYTPAFDAERGDVDLLVEYPPDHNYGSWLSKHFSLEEDLSILLRRKVDVVMPPALHNRWFREGRKDPNGDLRWIRNRRSCLTTLPTRAASSSRPADVQYAWGIIQYFVPVLGREALELLAEADRG